MARRERNVPGTKVGTQIRSPQEPTPAEVNLFPIPLRPTKLLIEPAACKSLKINKVGSRALASLLITERGICGNRAGNRAAAEATLATSLRFSLGERAKKIPTDKGWDFEYWWRRGESNPRPVARHKQFYILSLYFQFNESAAHRHAAFPASHLFFRAVPSDPAQPDSLWMTLHPVARPTPGTKWVQS